MNESAKRRQELLAQMKSSNQFTHTFPAVHPRYGHIYHDLYPESKERSANHSLLFRTIVSVVIFLLFVSFDNSQTDALETYNSEIISQIQKSFDYEEIQEVWKEL